MNAVREQLTVLPYTGRLLNVGDGHRIHVNECGQPNGLPLVFLHGGPGSGSAATHRSLFHPSRYRAVLPDQRGCGLSTPLGEVRANTTAHLVADLECVRQTLGIERWIVFGGSWGSLLGLAYAQAHPQRVSGLVLRGIFLGSRAELQGYVRRLRADDPTAWHRFADGVPAAERRELLEAYLRRLCDEDIAVRAAAARRWLEYEAAMMGVAPPMAPLSPAQLAKARIQGHYLSNGCFVDAKSLLAGCRAIAHIPCAIIQGLADPVCPPAVAERLHATWPEARWLPVPGAGHSAFHPDITRTLHVALDDIAAISFQSRSPVCQAGSANQFQKISTPP
ncbi:MAG: proline iminopeptidase [Betaproteobacteria bacterium]|nr:MAG: proline iminopeptidase [Betaproteobacteria bacterium]